MTTQDLLEFARREHQRAASQAAEAKIRADIYAQLEDLLTTLIEAEEEHMKRVLMIDG